MALALRLAQLGRGWAHPGPLVGAVLVKGGRVVSVGYFRGGKHAEAIALSQAGEEARGATLYVNLEPCAHWGKNPPCADAIVEAGVSRAFVAHIDPNPKVNGRGIARLREAGIEVHLGLMQEEARRLNWPFIKWKETGLPHLTLKMALGPDGSVPQTRVTSAEANRWTHGLRGESAAVIVGVGTVLRDNPLLTARDTWAPRQPVRVVVDSRLRMPDGARVLDTSQAPTLVATSQAAPKGRIRELRARGVEVLVLGRDRVDLGALVEELGERELNPLLLEGGPTLAEAFLREGLVDRVVILYSPGAGAGSLRARLELGGFRVEEVRRVGREAVVIYEKETKYGA